MSDDTPQTLSLNDVQGSHETWTRINARLAYPHRGEPGNPLLQNPARWVKEPLRPDHSFQAEGAPVGQWVRYPALDGYLAWMEAFATLGGLSKKDRDRVTRAIGTVYAIQTDFLQKHVPVAAELDPMVAQCLYELDRSGSVYFPVGRYPHLNAASIKKIEEPGPDGKPKTHYDYTTYYIGHDPTYVSASDANFDDLLDGGKSRGRQSFITVKDPRRMKDSANDPGVLKEFLTQRILSLHEDKRLPTFVNKREESAHKDQTSFKDNADLAKYLSGKSPGSKAAALTEQGTVEGAKALVEDMLGEELSGRLHDFIEKNKREDVDRQFGALEQRLGGGARVAPHANGQAAPNGFAAAAVPRAAPAPRPPVAPPRPISSTALALKGYQWETHHDEQMGDFIYCANAFAAAPQEISGEMKEFARQCRNEAIHVHWRWRDDGLAIAYVKQDGSPSLRNLQAIIGPDAAALRR